MHCASLIRQPEYGCCVRETQLRCESDSQLISDVFWQIRSGSISLSTAMAWDERGATTWQECISSKPMLILLARVDPASCVRAACACARHLLNAASITEGSARAALAAVDRWAATGVPDRLRAAGRRVRRAHRRHHRAFVRAKMLASYQRDAEGVQHFSRRATASLSYAEACYVVAHVAVMPYWLHDDSVPFAYHIGLHSDAMTEMRAAEVVRATAACPTLAELCAAAERYRR